MLSPNIHDALGQLLQGLQSADNGIRSYAEEQLNNEWVISRPDVLLMGLVEQLQASQDISVGYRTFRYDPLLGEAADISSRQDALLRCRTLSKNGNKDQEES